MSKGWYGNKMKHGLASKGIRTNEVKLIYMEHLDLSKEGIIKLVHKYGNGEHIFAVGFNEFILKVEPWEYECVAGNCGHLDGDDFEACANEEAYFVTHKVIPEELYERGYDIIDTYLEDVGDAPYGTSIVLAKKSKVLYD